MTWMFLLVSYAAPVDCGVVTQWTSKDCASNSAQSKKVAEQLKSSLAKMPTCSSLRAVPAAKCASERTKLASKLAEVHAVLAADKLKKPAKLK